MGARIGRRILAALPSVFTCTVEFVERGMRTQLILTDEGDDAGEHATGWAPALNNLERLLA